MKATWFNENWHRIAIILATAALVVIASAQAWGTYSAPCPPCQTPTPHPYDAPVKVPSSAIVLPTVNPYPLPTPLGEGSGAFAVAAVAKPTWWNMTEAQRRLSKEVAMSKLFGAGGKLQGLAAFEADRLYQVAWEYDLGYMMTNSLDACSGECWRCMAFRDAVVCGRKNGEIGVIEWSVGPQIIEHVTPPAPPAPPK